MSPRDFETAVSRLLDGDLSAGEFAQLESHLRASAGARARYLDCIDLHNLLQLELGPRALVQPAPAAVIPMDRILQKQRRKALRAALLAAAAVVMLGATVMWYILVPDRPPVLSFRAVPGSALTVTHASNGDAPRDGQLEPGSRLQLADGALELRFGTGVRSIIQAPADLTLHDEDHLHLEQGTAWFEVPAEAVGFTVQTPGVTAVDLGTEFGVLSGPDDRDEVHVFTGAVEITARHGAHRTVTLAAGQSRALDGTDRFVVIEPDPQRFARTLSSARPSLHWSFDEPDPQQLAVQGVDPAAGEIATAAVSPGPEPALASVPGRFGNALASLGTGGLVETNWPGIGGDAPRTLACWVKLEPGRRYDHPVAGWGLRQSGSGNRAFFAYVRTISGGATVAGASFGDYFLEGRTPIDDGRWHHFAVVYSGRTRNDGAPEVSCYLDGEPERTNPRLAGPLTTDWRSKLVIDTDITDPASAPLTLFSHLCRGDDHTDGVTGIGPGNNWSDLFPQIGLNNPYFKPVPPAADELWLEPGHAGNSTAGRAAALLRWTAGPADTGPFAVSGRIRMLTTYKTGCDGIRLHLLLNGAAQITPLAISAGNTTGRTFDLEIPVTPGDTLDFLVDNGPADNNNGDSAGLSVTLAAATGGNPVRADLRRDFVAGAAPGQTTAATRPGQWNYHAIAEGADPTDPANLTLLAWDSFPFHPADADGVRQSGQNYEAGADPHGHRVPLALDELRLFPFAVSGREIRHLHDFNQLDPPE